MKRAMKRAICSTSSAGFVVLMLCVAAIAQTGKPAAKQKPAVSETPKIIVFEVLIIETKGAAKDDRIVDLAGPSDEVAARIRELDKQGKLDVVDRIRLTTVENQQALVQTGRTKAVESGRSIAQRGGSSRSTFQFRQFGTLVSVTARVDGKTVIAELTVEKSDLERSGGNKARKSDADFQPPETVTSTVKTTLSIPSGKTVIVGGVQTTSKTSSSQRIILASARIVNRASGSKQAGAAATAPRQLKIFRLQHASAAEAARIVNEIFADRKAFVRVTTDERTNSLLIQSEKGLLDTVEALLLRLDEAKK